MTAPGRGRRGAPSLSEGAARRRRRSGRRRRRGRSGMGSSTASPAPVTATSAEDVDVVQVCGPADLRLCLPGFFSDVRRLAHQQGVVEIFPRAPPPSRRARELVSIGGARATRSARCMTVDQLGGVPARLGVIQQVASADVDRRFSVRTLPRKAPRPHSVRGRTPARAARPERRRVVLTVTAAKSTLEVARRRPRPPSRRDVRGAEASWLSPPHAGVGKSRKAADSAFLRN